MEREYYDNGKLIIPFRPYYCSNGNLILKQWEEPFKSRCGKEAILTKIIYKDRKGKVSDEIVARVRWV